MHTYIHVYWEEQGRERAMEIKHRGHQHPLTLCEKENDGKPACYGCGNTFLNKSYTCNNCKFFPQDCYACASEPSASGNSYYICKKCWPDSPFFHKPCAELPPQIEISAHAHRSLYVVGDFTDSDDEMKECGFCSKIPEENRYTFCCRYCDYKISYGCAAMLVTYHEGREHVDYVGHKHPLTVLELDDSDKYYCQICYKNIHGSSYGCAPCGFYVHDSCRELRQEIEHPSHNLHSMMLQEAEYFETRSCSACGGEVKGFAYCCEECHFVLHPRCASQEPNIE